MTPHIKNKEQGERLAKSTNYNKYSQKICAFRPCQIPAIRRHYIVRLLQEIPNIKM